MTRFLPDRTLSWLCSRGLAASVAAAARHQQAPSLHMRVGTSSGGVVPSRRRGTLTGSRAAGAMGRAIIRYLLEHLVPCVSCSGFECLGGARVGVLTYVDNLVFVTNDASTAEGLLAEARRCLDDVWGLTLPPSSVDLLLPAGASSAPVELVPVATMRALCFVVAANGGCVAIPRAVLHEPRFGDICRLRVGRATAPRRSAFRS